MAGASLPINYGTTYYALKRRAKAASGESLLILGASGGVGTASIQLGKILGLTTIAAIGSDEKEEYVKNLGVDHIIRYDKENLKESAKKTYRWEGCGTLWLIQLEVTLRKKPCVQTAWNGRLLVIGFAQGEIPKIPLNITLVKGVSIVGVLVGKVDTNLSKRNSRGL